MSILDMFRSAPASAVAAPTPLNGQPLTPPGVPSLDTAPNPAQPAPAINPMDKFAALWEAPKEGEVVTENFDPAKMFQIDPVKIQQAVSQINFGTSITPDIMAKINAGGEEATQAMMTAMNSVAQQAFAQSMMGASKLVETAMTQANSSLDKRIQNSAKSLQAQSALREANPMLTHPGAAPLITAMEAQFAMKHPGATAAELTKMSQDYLLQFAEVASGPKAPAPVPQGEVDWDQYLRS
jgi:hypothetical protein